MTALTTDKHIIEKTFSMKGFHFSDGNSNDSLVVRSQAVTGFKILHLFPCVLIFTKYNPNIATLLLLRLPGVSHIVI